MDILSEIWGQVFSLINWAIFSIVIAIGYLARKKSISGPFNTTYAIIISTFIVTLAYTLITRESGGTFIVSYFVAIGFHSAIIKQIEKWLKIPKEL